MHSSSTHLNHDAECGRGRRTSMRCTTCLPKSAAKSVCVCSCTHRPHSDVEHDSGSTCGMPLHIVSFHHFNRTHWEGKHKWRGPFLELLFSLGYGQDTGVSSQLL